MEGSTCALNRLARVVLLVAIALGATVMPAAAQSETIEYYGLDALGSVRVIFNAQGTVVDRMNYGPFGENLGAGVKFPAEMFAQLARDAESGQDYAQARNYSASTGRFNRVDPVYAGLFDPQKWNRFSYSLNAPLTYIDPKGQNPLGLGAFTLGVINAMREAGAFDPNRSGTVLGQGGGDLFKVVDDDWGMWDDLRWAVSQLLDIFTTTVTGSDVPGEDEPRPTPRDTPSNTAQIAVATVGIVSSVVPGRSVSRILLFRNPQTVQKGFTKHGPDFGLKGKWNANRASEFRAAVNRHINDPDTRQIVGMYRDQPAVHNVNPQTGLNVVARPDGSYWTGYQLSSGELKSVLTTGWLW
jgi:RHS repeat-associated protein